MHFNAADIIRYLFTAYVTFNCVMYIRGGNCREDFQVFQGWSLKEWLGVIAGNLLCLAGVVGIAFFFIAYVHIKLLGYEVFNFSWLYLLIPHTSSGEQAGAINLTMSGMTIPYFGILFLVLLGLCLPSYAMSEEKLFRQGTKDWIDAIPRSVKFGLIHFVVGIPVCAAIALILPGFWFTKNYFEGDVKKSTFTHAVYNYIVFIFLFAASIALTFFKAKL